MLTHAERTVRDGVHVGVSHLFVPFEFSSKISLPFSNSQNTSPKNTSILFLLFDFHSSSDVFFVLFFLVVRGGCCRLVVRPSLSKGFLLGNLGGARLTSANST